MAEVLKRENVDRGCIYVGPTTNLTKFGNETEFRNEALRDAAKEAAKRQGKPGGKPGSIQVNTGTCLMEVYRPLIHDDYAFVSFSDPGGEIGTYGFVRKGSRWNVIEKNLSAIW